MREDAPGKERRRPDGRTAKTCRRHPQIAGRGPQAVQNEKAGTCMKKISVLGSTGSIGTQTLDIVRANGDIQVTALAVDHNITALEKQIREFKPRIACVWDERRAAELKVSVADLPVKVVSGMEGLIEAATEASAQTVVTAVVGMIGIRPTIAAIEAGKDIALANKETLVTAGHLIMPLARRKGVRILPVDSEHSAIFQCLTTLGVGAPPLGWTEGAAEKAACGGSVLRNAADGDSAMQTASNSGAEVQTAKDREKMYGTGTDNAHSKTQLTKILLTASGGPFRGYTRQQLQDVTLEDALRHPNWSMGRKVTIDSSTMVNKGLEVMEARWLFDVPVSQIQVVIQPKSIIHSMVEFADGAVLAQLGTPDMKLPIQYALYYPERRPLGGERLDFWSLTQIAFEKPDTDTFRALRLAYRAAEAGGTMPAVFNAANEHAVARFINHWIPYLTITDMIEAAMSVHKPVPDPTLEQILAAEQETYEFLRSRF